MGVGLTEILTESFCERCGTRYTFESTGRRWGGVTRLRVLSRGLRNLVMTDGLSAKDAMAAARMDEGVAASVEQLDAFHRTFSFCLSCRQYTCANCWNEPEGKCLTCAPDLSREVLPAAFPDLPSQGPVPAVGADNGRARIEAWPTADLLEVAPLAVPAAAEPVVAEAVAAAVAAPEAAALAPEPVTEPVAVAEAVAAPEAAAPAPEPVTEPVAVAAPETVTEPSAPSSTRVEATAERLTEDELAAVAGTLVARSASASADAAAPAATDRPDPVAAGRSQTTSLLGRFRPPRRQLEDEGKQAPAAGTAAIPAGSAPEAPGEPAAEPTIATVAPASAPPPTPAPAVPAVELPVPETPARTAPGDVVPQPTWRIVAPEPTDATTTDAGRPTVLPPAPASGPLLRARPAPRAGGSPATPWAARLASARPAAGGVWAESSRDVLGPSGPAAPTGVQACVSCGLPLSANARFCRRCGSRQD